MAGGAVGGGAVAASVVVAQGQIGGPGPVVAGIPAQWHTARYKIGDYVNAEWDDGEWYAGSVAGVNLDQTYVVSYDDGDLLPDVKEKHIRLIDNASEMPPPPGWIQPGQRVRAVSREDQSYYSGTLAAVSPNGTYSVSFDEGEFVEFIPHWDIKPLPAVPQFNIGERIKGCADDDDDWYDGRIETINPDGTYGVAYDDGDYEEAEEYWQLRPHHHHHQY